MNIWEIEKMLPNGFHDTFLKNILIDYEEREITMNIELLVGNPEGKTTDDREAYKNAVLKVKNFFYCIIEQPHPKYPFAKKGALWVDFAKIDTDREISKSIHSIEIPGNAFSFCVYVSEWNSCFYISAIDADLQWES